MSDGRQPATLQSHSIRQENRDHVSLTFFLGHVHERRDKHDIQGLAFATNGTWPVVGLSQLETADTPTLEVVPIEGRQFEQGRVFELRLWAAVSQPGEPANGQVLAHEFRWVNGVGAVDLKLTQDGEGSASAVSWAHHVAYLQHGRSGDGEPPAAADHDTDPQAKGHPTMTAIEFIQEEKEYGNTVVIDQLFTGHWS